MGPSVTAGPFIFMIGLSTSIFTDLPGAEIIDKIANLGIVQIELNFTLTSKQVSEIIRIAPKAGINIVSLHNFVPEPPEKERAFALSDIDQTLRRRAVELTRDTILLASDIGARAVILHMGQPRGWDYDALQHQLRTSIRDQADPHDIETLRTALIEKRKGLPGAYLDSMLRSLDEILSLSDDLDISLGVENRYFYGQFPNFEELGILLQEFSGSRLGYWHDCGHARQNEYCGLGTSIEQIESFQNLLIGIHLHDTNLWTDHRLPNPNGDIDFSYLKPFIKQTTILNLEPAKGVDPAPIQSALAHLRSFGII
jgi:sugar phosphate isomerase/epimerase